MTDERKKMIGFIVIILAFSLWVIDEAYTIGYLNGMHYVQELRR
jgi:hypothetical protein